MHIVQTSPLSKAALIAGAFAGTSCWCDREELRKLVYKLWDGPQARTGKGHPASLWLNDHLRHLDRLGVVQRQTDIVVITNPERLDRIANGELDGIVPSKLACHYV